MSKNLVSDGLKMRRLAVILEEMVETVDWRWLITTGKSLGTKYVESGVEMRLSYFGASCNEVLLRGLVVKMFWICWKNTYISRVVLMRSVTIMFLPFFLLFIHVAWTIRKRISSYVPLKYVRGICKSSKSKMAANDHFFLNTVKDNF